MRNLLTWLALVGIGVSASAEEAWVSLSKVAGIEGYKGRVALFGVKGELSQVPLEFRGAGSEFFAIRHLEKGENSLLLLEIEFSPPEEKGLYSAELVVGTGSESQLVQLRGLAMEALEGTNEPPLQEILQSLGSSVDAGGQSLRLDTEKRTIGDSIKATRFEPVAGAKVVVSPLARFSPPGETSFGFVSGEGDEAEWKVLGSLSDTTGARPDAHQTLRPPLSSGVAAIEVADAPKRFSFFLKGPQYTSLTFPGKSAGAPIEHTARIYPVEKLAGRSLTNAYLIACEEAANGDYQDAVFLLEGVKAVK